MSWRASLLLFALAAVTGASPAGAELSARSVLEGGDLAVHQSVEWRIVLEGSGTTVPEPEFTEPDWAQITPLGTEQSVRFENGRMSSAVVYRFLVVPRRAGRFRLPAVILRVGQSRVTTEAVPVLVLPESLPRSTGADGGGSLRLVVALDRERCVVGEPVRMTIRFYQASRLSERQYWGPATPGFWAEPNSVPRSYYAPEGGRRWLVTESHAFLYPTVSGSLTVGTARMLCLVESEPGGLSSPFRIGTPGEEVVTVESQPVRLTAVPLPSAGRPPEFSGAVGEFELSLAVARDTIRADETLDLTVRLHGTGNLRIAGQPAWPELPDFEVYARTTEDSLDLEGEAPRGVRRIELSLLPRRQGRLTLPPLRYAIYTPGVGYRRLVVPGRAVAVGPPLGRLAGAGALRPLELPSGVLRPPRPTAGVLALALGACGILWTWAWWARHRRGQPRSAALARRRAELSQRARAAEGETWLREAERWLTEEPEAGTRPESRAARQVLLERVRALRYGGASRPGALSDLAAALDRQLHEAERLARRPVPRVAWLVGSLSVILLLAAGGFAAWRVAVSGHTEAIVGEWQEARRELAAGDDGAAEERLAELWQAGWRGGPLAAQASVAALRGRRLGRAALWMERARREDPGHPFVLEVRRALDEEGALPGHPEGLGARLAPRTVALGAAVLLLAGQALLAAAWGGRRTRWRRAWPGAALSVLAAGALALAAGLAGAGYGSRAGVIVRGTSLVAEPGGEPELDLEPGRLVVARETRDGHRRVGLGGGLTGWVRESDVVAVRVGPAAAEEPGAARAAEAGP